MNPFKALLDRSEIALRSTTPLFRSDDLGRLEVFATGVFFRHGGQHFLLSAAHALVELRTRALWVSGENSIVQLAGPFFHTGHIGQTDFDGDSFDVAFVPLDEDQVSRLGGAVFQSESTVGGVDSNSQDARYYAVGFVARDFRPTASSTQVVVKGTAIMAAPAPPLAYEQRGVAMATHLLLSFNRRRTHSEERQEATPRIAGMSGCGIWRRRLLPWRDTLVALLTEHHEGGRKVIVSTRVSTIVPALAGFVSGHLQGSTQAVQPRAGAVAPTVPGKRVGEARGSARNVGADEEQMNHHA